MPSEPIGSSMAASPHRSAGWNMVGYVERITADPDAYDRHQRLVNKAQELELYARELGQTALLRRPAGHQLKDWGADPQVARQAAEIGLACFYAYQKRRLMTTRGSSPGTSAVPLTAS